MSHLEPISVVLKIIISCYYYFQTTNPPKKKKQKGGAPTSEQWEEWKQKDEQMVDGNFENELQQVGNISS